MSIRAYAVLLSLFSSQLHYQRSPSHSTSAPSPHRFFYTLEVALPNLCYDFYMIVSALPDANPNHWRLGIFYFNRQDRRLFVPKRRGFGWTLNFANIWAWLLVGLIIFVLIARLLNRGVKGRV